MDKKLKFHKAFVLYHVFLAMLGVLLRKQMPPILWPWMQSNWPQVVLFFSGGFVFVWGAKKILYYEFIYRPGRRLLAKEAHLKRDGIDFDHIRQEDR
jgi:hypothetical protein